ncbi:hypothetical protein N665_0970s0006 [Sinapis alba]|nr:hypothetical protein N665_0970s0006 [Sinapis alba]
MHCGIRDVANHNSRFHKNNPKKSFVSGESSQPEASQGFCNQGELILYTNISSAHQQRDLLLER